MSFRMLIAEDEEITLNNIVDTLRDEGYDVTGTKDGSEALLKLEKDHYDVLITDIKMPGLSGIDLLGKVKEKQPDGTDKEVEKEFTVNRTDAIAHVGSAALDNEECYLLQKMLRSWGLVYIEHQARI